MLLHKDLALKIQAFAHLHEFVGIACITIFAGELAAPVRVDHPRKWHSRRVAACQHRAVFKRDVFNIMSFVDGLALCRKLGDTYEPLSGCDLGKKGRHKPPIIRFLFAI